MRAKLWLLPAILLLLAGGLYWFLMIPAAVTPSGPESQARFQSGHYAVLSEDFTIVDESRATPPNRDLAGYPGRVLEGTLWRPKGLSQPGPLLVHSHGFTSGHLEATYLAKFLASHGYTVAAVDYPLTSYHTPGKPQVTDLVNQPGDVSFVLDTLLERNTTQGDPLHGTIDPARIAVSGISLGGLTTTLTTFHPRFRDPRISAAISIAGPSEMLLPTFFAGTDTPYLAVYGDSDVVVPYPGNGKPLPGKKPGSILVTLKGGSHGGFIQLASTAMRFMSSPDTLVCRRVIAGLESELAEDNPLYIGALGEAEQGIDTDTDVEICATPPPDKTMQAARQHMYTMLAAYSFLDSLFNPDASRRSASADYLLNGLSRENAAEINVEFR